MKQRGWPLWLLRDVRAFLAVLFSSWTLTIFTIASERKAMRTGKVSPSFHPRYAMLLAAAEAWLDWAFWRQAHRRLGLDHRAVKLRIIPPTTTKADTLLRSRLYDYAFEHMQLVVDSHVDALRQRYRISARDLVAHGSTDATLCVAAHHELVRAAPLLSQRAPLALILSSARSARPSKDARGYTHARGPPARAPIFRNHPPQRSARLRTRPHAQNKKGRPNGAAFSNSNLSRTPSIAPAPEQPAVRPSGPARA